MRELGGNCTPVRRLPSTVATGSAVVRAACAVRPSVMALTSSGGVSAQAAGDQPALMSQAATT
jgi:hypothetical protein